jgi:Secretion system C-terminal sorting domain/Redoxin
MKKLFTLFCSIITVCSLQAQLAPNSLAPDFTVTDIEGNSINLYEIVESGRPVVMDVSATWCGPCWNYHNNHVLKDLYNQYGQGGTNELYVLFVEGDGSTNLDCLYDLAGCNVSSQGDWVTGTPYPIVDDASISDAYQVDGFPTVFMICTNHLVREMPIQPSLTYLYTQATNCPDPVQGVSVKAFELTTDLNGGSVCGTQTVIPTFSLLNEGTVTFDSMEIELKVNGQVKEVLNYTNDIETFMPDFISFAPVDLTGNSILRATLKKINGTELTTSVFKQKSYQKTKATATQSVTLEFKTDGYGEEMYWEAIDDQGNVLASGGNITVGPNLQERIIADEHPTAYGDNITVTEVFDVPNNGCFYLHMVDAYADGNCFGAGSESNYIKVFETANPSNILFNIDDCPLFLNRYDLFGAEGLVNVHSAVEVAAFNVAPNPANEQLRVEYTLKSSTDVQVTLVNTVGQVVRSIQAGAVATGQQFAMVPTADLANGIYVLNLRTAEGQISRKVTVQH